MTAIRLGSETLHARLKGNPGHGTVLVFSNSLGTDLRIWEPVIENLPASIAVLTYDKRGHGLSTANTPAATIADHAEDLAGVLDHFGVKAAIICGLSVGGLIAQSLALARPDLVAGLILCDTAPKIGTAESWNGRIDAVKSGGLASIIDPVMERWFTEGFRASSPDYPLYRSMFAQQSVAGYIATCAAIRDADLTETTKTLSVPVQVVVGEDDRSTPPDLVAAMAAIIPGAQFDVIADCGHIPPVEQPVALSALILRFLSRLEAVPFDRHAQGMTTRRLVLGDAHVNRAEAAKTMFDAPFQALITEAAWGHVWSRPDWSLRERSMVTIALLAALGHDEEIAMHVRATANTGATPEDLREALLHVAIYAGVPAANRAIRIVKETLARMADRNET